MGYVELGLVTDTAADLSPRFLEEEAVGLVPIYVHLGGRRYKDWRELTPDALYQAIRAGAEPVIPFQGDLHGQEASTPSDPGAGGGTLGLFYRVSMDGYGPKTHVGGDGGSASRDAPPFQAQSALQALL